MGWRVLVLAVLALAAAGCGGGDAPTATSSDPVAGSGSDSGGSGSTGSGDRSTRLTIVVDGGEFDRLTYTVTCGPGGAEVEPVVAGVDASTACTRLADAATASRLVDGPDPNRMCTEVYGGPQQAHLTGSVGGRAVDATVSRVNGCEIDAWDRLLAGVLPPTSGVQGGG